MSPKIARDETVILRRDRVRGADLLGLDGEVRGIAMWVPVMLFAFLFGISMDYQVFLVERMRELRDGGEPNRRAVRLGLASTGRVVATAALIMVVAFVGFVGGWTQ